MITNTHIKKQIRDIHLENPFMSVKDISESIGCSYSYTCECLETAYEYFIVGSLNTENEYFLFTDIVEKTIKTDCQKRIQNGYDFNSKEKVFLKGYGFKF